MANVQKPKKAKAHVSFATVLLILGLLAGFGYTMSTMQTQVLEAEAQQSALEAQVSAQIQYNESLRSAIEEGGTEEQMIDIARDELGLVAPGEKVFYDVSN